MRFAFSFKLTKILKIFCSLFLIAALCVGAAALSPALKSPLPSALKTVVLDAGHGGFDGGTTSVYGAVEKDINLAIALKTRDFLSAMGYRVVMTREGDYALAHSKKEDMQKRLEIIRQNPDSVFISIHQNFFSQSKYLGAQMFYGRGEESEKLSEILQQNFKANLNPNNERKIKASQGLYLFKNSPVPSVLVECGFLSNPDETRLLCDENYQKKIAFCIFSAILNSLVIEDY